MWGLRNQIRTFLFLSAAVVYLGKAYNVSLRGIDSNIHGAVARRLVSEPWGALRLPLTTYNEYSWGGAGQRRPFEVEQRLLKKAREKYGAQPSYAVFNDHPYLMFWIHGVVMKWIGPSFAAARLPTGLSAAATVVAVFELGLALSSMGLGAGAAVIFLATREFVVSSTGVSLDPPLVLAIVLSFLAWVRGKWVLASCLAGFGLWIKSPVGLLLFPAMALAALFGKERIRGLIRVILGLSISLTVVATHWLIVGWLAGDWSIVSDYWLGQFGGTVVGGRVGGGSYDPWYFIRHLGRVYWPWLPLVIWGVIWIVRKRILTAAPVVAGCAVLILVFLPQRSLMPHYILPIYPLLALMGAWPLERWLNRNIQLLAITLGAFTFFAISAAVVPWFSFGPEPFPDLVRFAPVIKEHASCELGGGWVPGGEVRGAAPDGVFWLNFVADRPIYTYRCTQLMELPAAALPGFLIISGPQLAECDLAGPTLKYPHRYSYGERYIALIAEEQEAIQVTALGEAPSSLGAIFSSCP